MNLFDLELMANAVLEQRASDLAAHRMRQRARAARGPRRGRIRLLGLALPGSRQRRESAGSNASA